MARWSKKPNDNIPVGRGRLRKLLPSGVWHFHHRNTGGRWVSRSTSHRDKAGAIRWAEAFSLKLTKEEFGDDGPKRPRRDRLVQDVVAEWLQYQESQNSPYTHRSYRSITKKFRRFLDEKKIGRLRMVTRELIMSYRQWCLERGNSKVTIDNNLITLRSFFNWCLSRGEIARNPISQQRHGERVFFDERIDRKEAYTRDEVGRILRAASGDDRRVVRLLASWGLRISELVMLEWSDLDFKGGWVHIRNKVTHDGVRYRPKDKTDRKIPLEDPQVRTTLEEFATRTGRKGYVLPLPRVKSRRDYAERTLLERLKRLAKTTGVPRTKLTLHRFRHYFVSECADCGIPMATTMTWVGHDELKMVLYYYSLRDEPAREAMRRFAKRDQSADGGREDQDRRTGDAGKSEGVATESADQNSSAPTDGQTDAAGPPAPYARGVPTKRMPGSVIGAPGTDSKRGHQRADKQRRVS